MGLRDRQAVFSGMLGRLLCKAEDLGTPVFINELNRSIETQRAYFMRGASKTMKSKHLSLLNPLSYISKAYIYIGFRILGVIKPRQKGVSK